jgi:hypothetical protein
VDSLIPEIGMIVQGTVQSEDVNDFKWLEELFMRAASLSRFDGSSVTQSGYSFRRHSNFLNADGLCHFTTDHQKEILQRILSSDAFRKIVIVNGI